MKRVFLVFLVAFLICSSVSCESVATNSGIENFSIHDCSYGLNQYLIPEDFLNLFDYSDGGYDYYAGGGAYIYVTTLLYMQYDEDTYHKAKEYVLDHLELIEKTEELYGDYMFFKRDLHFYDSKGKEEHTQRFYFAYSDEQRILLAVGTYMSGPYMYKSDLLTDYLETYFSFYNFEEGKIERETETESQRVESLTYGVLLSQQFGFTIYFN